MITSSNMAHGVAPQESGQRKLSSDTPNATSFDRAPWEARAKNLLRAELRRRGISSEELADRLRQIGVQDNARNVSNKISRGVFSAVFLLQCLHVIGAKDIHLID